MNTACPCQHTAATLRREGLAERRCHLTLPSWSGRRPSVARRPRPTSCRPTRRTSARRAASSNSARVQWRYGIGGTPFVGAVGEVGFERAETGDQRVQGQEEEGEQHPTHEVVADV